jgi:hypothetical protein
VVVPSPGTLVPSETKLSETLPDFAPAVLLSIPTVTEVFAVGGEVAARPLKLPVAVNPAGDEPTLPLRSSVKAETGAVLVMLIAWLVTVLPWRTLPKLIGCVLLTVACARLNTPPVMLPDTPTS